VYPNSGSHPLTASSITAIWKGLMCMCSGWLARPDTVHSCRVFNGYISHNGYIAQHAGVNVW
jgi:hypothetical protein